MHRSTNSIVMLVLNFRYFHTIKYRDQFQALICFCLHSVFSVKIFNSSVVKKPKRTERLRSTKVWNESCGL